MFFDAIFWVLCLIGGSVCVVVVTWLVRSLWVKRKAVDPSSALYDFAKAMESGPWERVSLEDNMIPAFLMQKMMKKNFLVHASLEKMVSLKSSQVFLLPLLDPFLSIFVAVKRTMFSKASFSLATMCKARQNMFTGGV